MTEIDTTKTPIFDEATIAALQAKKLQPETDIDTDADEVFIQTEDDLPTIH